MRWSCYSWCLRHYGFGLNDVDRPVGVEKDYLLGAAGGFRLESVAQAATEVVALGFHAIELTIESPGSRLRRKIEHEGHVGLEAAGRHFADAPKFIGIKTAGVPLVDDIREQKAIADHRFAPFERRPDRLLDELRRAAMYRNASARRLIAKSPRSSSNDRTASPSGVLPGSRHLTTRSPRSASHAQNSSIWVDLPWPSIPSKL